MIGRSRTAPYSRRAMSRTARSTGSSRSGCSASGIGGLDMVPVVSPSRVSRLSFVALCRLVSRMHVRLQRLSKELVPAVGRVFGWGDRLPNGRLGQVTVPSCHGTNSSCLLYTSDAADE